MGLDVYSLAAELLPGQAAELDSLVRLLQRETWLLPMGLYVDARTLEELDRSMVTAPGTLERFLERIEGVVFLDSEEFRPRLRRPAWSGKSSGQPPPSRPPPGPGAIGRDTGDLAGLLAGQFDLELSAISRISEEAQARGS